MPNPFKPGDPRINRNGRPKKGKTLTDILEKHLRRRRFDDDEKRRSAKELLAKQVIDLALAGDLTAIKYIFDRIDGKPTETVDTKHSGNIRVGIDRIIYDSVHGNDDTDEADVDDEAD